MRTNTKLNMLPNCGTTGLKHLSHYMDSDGSDENDLKPTDSADSQKNATLKNESKQLKNDNSPSRAQLSDLTELATKIELSPYRQFYNDIKLPPLPKAEDETDKEKLDEFKRLTDRLNSNMIKVNRGLNIVEHIRNSRAFKNPSIYEKLLKHCNVVEYSSNYDKNIFDPMSFDEKEGNYKILGERQMRAFESKKNLHTKGRRVSTESSRSKEKRHKDRDKDKEKDKDRDRETKKSRHYRDRSRSRSRGRKRKSR